MSKQNISWKELSSANGISVRSLGAGQPVVIIPGMEGSGESCTDLIEWIHTQNQSYAFYLVDYAKENFAEFNELVSAISKIIQNITTDPVVLWSQSFGNAIAVSIASENKIKISKHAMLSPFASIPSELLLAGSYVLKLTPTWVYKLFSLKVSIFLFGPVKGYEQHRFFEVLEKENPQTYLKRILWLRKLDIEKMFSSVKAPTQVWIGNCDRVIRPQRQIAYFKSRGVKTIELPKLGHMLFPGLLDEAQRITFLDWPMEPK